MKFKFVPDAPDDLETVREAQRAVPLVPGTEDDCCARLMRRLDFDARDRARTWLTFLRALGLAERGENGFTRTRRDVTQETVAAALRENVFGTEDVLRILREADDPLTPADVFARYRDEVPQWERHKNPKTWESEWRERTARLLDWLALTNCVTEHDGAYTA